MWNKTIDTIVKKTSKEYKCDICCRTIPKGSKNILYSFNTFENK